MSSPATMWLDERVRLMSIAWAEGTRWRAKDLRTPAGARIVAKCPGCKHKDPAENVELP